MILAIGLILAVLFVGSVSFAEELTANRYKKLVKYYQNEYNKVGKQLSDMILNKPNKFVIMRTIESNKESRRVYAVYGGNPILLKSFDSDDQQYNQGLAEELKEKLEEKI